MVVLAVLIPVDTDQLVLPGERPEAAICECTIGVNDHSAFSYTCEPFQSPVSVLVDKRKGLEKCKIKSLSKFYKLRDSYTLRPVSRFVARGYSLHNLFIPHNSSLSQLQTFII